ACRHRRHRRGDGGLLSTHRIEGTGRGRGLRERRPVRLGLALFSVGPTVYLPIFQGGRLKRRLELTEARQKEAALAYRQTVLQAWHEVDDALDACSAQKRRHQELQVAYRQNELALQSARRGYQQGVADYLQVLSAQRQLLASQTMLNASATNTALTVVEL